MAEMAMFMAAASTVMSAVSSQQQGAAADRAATFRAEQLEQAAGQERAGAQRAAMEQRRQGRLALSRLQAIAGGGGLDPTVVTLAGRLAGEGEYRALSALYEGEERALGMEMQGEAARYEGRLARRAGNMRALSSVVSFAGSSQGSALYDKIKGLGAPGSGGWAGQFIDDSYVRRGQMDY
jgi:hypothetical protein